MFFAGSIFVNFMTKKIFFLILRQKNISGAAFFCLGCKYYYMPWASKKPLLMLTAQWEDVNFRLHHLNFILRICQKVVCCLEI